jgi:solute carrier family 8 (sodium/calcium exchanger)
MMRINQEAFTVGTHSWKE